MEDPTNTEVDPIANAPDNPTGVETDQPVDGANAPDTPTGVVEEKEEQATPEQLKEINARNQQLYQNLVRKTKEYDPAIFKEHREEMTGEPESTELPGYEFEEEDGYTTKEDLKKGFMSMEERLFERMNRGEQEKHKAKKADTAKQEYTECNAALNEFLDGNQIPEDVMNHAIDLVRPMRINVGTEENPTLGGPSAFVYAIATVLGPWIKARQMSFQNKSHLGNIEVDAADRGREAGLLVQPASGRTGISSPGAGQKKADEVAPDTPYVYQR